MMLVSSYFNTPIKLKRFISSDNDMNIPSYADEEIIYVRADGQAGLRYFGNKVINSTDYIYLTIEDITIGSLINEMPVKNIEPIYEFNGDVSHYEVIAGPTG